jgi:parvulin-like peptidyl-prolyl isomerase
VSRLLPDSTLYPQLRQFDYAARFVAAKQGQNRKSAGRQRLALVVFGALLVLLFAGFAIAQGIGSPSVPDGDVAIVEGVPDEIGTISEADLKRAVLQQAASGGQKKTPKPGEKKYEELQSAALSELLNTIWIQGEADEMGIAVTPKQIADELAQIKKQNFKTEAEYQEFLKTSQFTKEDVLTRVKLQLLSSQIQEQIAKEAPPPSESEIASYYDSVKDTQFTTAESRDVRVVINEDKAKAEEAKTLLEKDDSPASWEKVTAKFSEDPTTKNTGGLQRALSEELLASQPELKDAFFGSPAGVLVGPTDIQGKYFVIEVDKLNPAKVQTLKEASGQIRTQLTQQLAQEVFSGFVSEFQVKWESRTFCADDFEDDELVGKCSNYAGSGRPVGAPPACYEADPKGGPPAACPAPVTSVAPALPGSTTALKPQGDRKPQRPRPEGLDPASEEALPETLPPSGAGGAVPPPPGE